MSSPSKSPPSKSSFYNTFKSRSSSSAKNLQSGVSGVRPSVKQNNIQGLMGMHTRDVQKGRKRKPTKVQRMMSANPEDICKNLLSEGGGVLAPLEYSVFWNNVSAARFIARCIKFLMDYENDPEKMMKGLKKTEAEMGKFVVSFYFVLNMLNSFKPTHSFNSLQTCLLHTMTAFDLFSSEMMGGSTSNIALTRGFEVFAKHKKNKPRPHDQRIYEVLSRIQKHQASGQIAVVSMVVECAALVPLFSMNMGGGGEKKKRQCALDNSDLEVSGVLSV